MKKYSGRIHSKGQVNLSRTVFQLTLFDCLNRGLYGNRISFSCKLIHPNPFYKFRCRLNTLHNAGGLMTKPSQRQRAEMQQINTKRRLNATSRSGNRTEIKLSQSRRSLWGRQAFRIRDLVPATCSFSWRAKKN